MPATIPYGAMGYTITPAFPNYTKTPSTLAGAMPFNYSPSAGGIPQVPNPAATQSSAIQGNLGNLGALGDLTKYVNQLGLDFASQLNKANLAQSQAQQGLSNQQAQWQNQLNQQQAERQQAMDRAQAAWQQQVNQQQALWQNQVNQGLGTWQQQQNAAIAAANNAAAQQFAREQDLANQQMIRAQQELYTPGLAGLETQASKNAAAELRGEVPIDVVNQLAQGAAERGAALGLGPRSPASSSALVRALGLTSLGQQKQGQADLSASIARTPNLPLYSAPFSTAPNISIPFANAPTAQAPYSQIGQTQAPFSQAPFANAQPFNPASMFISPADMQSAQYQSNLLNAAPIPSAAQNANLQSLMAGMRQGYGQTAPGNMFGGQAAGTSTQDLVNQIIQKYSQQQLPPSPFGSGSGPNAWAGQPPPPDQSEDFGNTILTPYETSLYDYMPYNPAVEGME